jgi:hypothetical protein
LPGVFLCHAHSDKLIVRRIAKDLQNYSADVWIDEAEINVGDSLIQKIREGIDKMDYLAVFLSPESIQSEWVKRELDVAMNQEIEGRRIKVLPVLIKNCEIPSFLKGKFFADFRNLDEYDSSLQLILRRLALPVNERSPKIGTGRILKEGSSQLTTVNHITYCRRCGTFAGTQTECTGIYTSHDFVTGSGIIYCSRCGATVGKKSECISVYTHHDFRSAKGKVFCRRCGVAIGALSQCTGIYANHDFGEI